MTTDEKWRRHREAVERWKAKNREYYLFQKKCLSGRPEYLQKRRENYRARRNDEKQNISTYKNDST
jgi:hypothetical protein